MQISQRNLDKSSPRRYEIKYLVPRNRLVELRRAIAPMVSLDKHAIGYEEKGYTVRSIYLDTPDLTYYFEKIEGIKIRKKLRIRGYNQAEDSKNVFLEIKRKDGGCIAKERSSIPRDALDGDLESWIRTQDENSKNSTVPFRAFSYYLYRNRLKPVNLVVYEREAFEGNADPSLRITFDKDLRSKLLPPYSTLYSEKDLKLIRPGYFILEVKYSHVFPSWLTPILSHFKLHKQALSKYVMSLQRCVGPKGMSLFSSTFQISPPPLPEQRTDIVVN